MQNLRESILRLPEVEARTGLKRERIRQLEVTGRFPLRLKINGGVLAQGAVGWVASEIDQWIADRIRSARATPRIPTATVGTTGTTGVVGTGTKRAA